MTRALEVYQLVDYLKERQDQEKLFDDDTTNVLSLLSDDMWLSIILKRRTPCLALQNTPILILTFNTFVVLYYSFK